MPPDECDAVPSLAPPSASVGVCACCFVWETTRGPHAGERLAFDALETPDTTLGIGRKSACWLRLRKDLEVSGLHAELTVAYTQDKQSVGKTSNVSLVLRDANSTNGTRANGQLLAKGESHSVRDQDLLQFGRTTVRVRMGNTQCARAREEKKKFVVTVGEPEDEPVAAASPRPAPENNENEQEPTPPVGTSDHSDENAFEQPSNRFTNKPTTPTPSPLLEMCMVCGQALAAWSVLEQQLHVNACLDKRSNAAPQRPTPTFPTVSAVSNLTTNSKKRKRQAKLVHDEELAVALALSESLVNKEQQVDTEMALVSGELAQIDAQLKKLEKKRAALVKKLEKLEKTKKKVQQSKVIGPEAAHALLDIALALRVLFPEARQAEARGTGEGEEERRERRRKARLAQRYRAVEDVETPSGAAYLTMWRRSAYGGGGGGEEEGEGDQVFVNRLLRRLQAQYEPEDKRNDDNQSYEPTNKPNDGNKGVPTNQRDVPDVVKRVFPNWEENLAFLTTQTSEDLKRAFAEMQLMLAERQEDGATEEAEACAFFEAEMQRLLAETHGKDDAEVVVLVDSQDDDDGSSTLEGEDGDKGSAAVDEECTSHTKSPPSVLSIDDSSEEEEELLGQLGVEDTEKPAALPEASDTMDVEPANVTLDVSRLDELADAPSAPLEAPERRPIGVGSDATLEQQLLTALKANEVLYERVLLLQPLCLSELLHYVRDDVGLKCPKSTLIAFCDRHGITFKSA